MVEQSSTNNNSTIKVLLVEDHLLTRVGLKTIIERSKDMVVCGEAANGEEAIKAVDQYKPDVILMDVGMPVMDGIEAAREIRTINDTVKIIMLTSHDSNSDIFASLAAGASGYCLKDVEPDRLYTAIRTVYAGDSWLDSTIAGRVLQHYSSQSKRSIEIEPLAAQTTATQVLTQEKSFQPLPEHLSQRELEVLGLIVEGLSNQQIADRLFISLATAKTHVRNILNKLTVDDRTQAAVQGMRRGLV